MYCQRCHSKYIRQRRFPSWVKKVLTKQTALHFWLPFPATMSKEPSKLIACPSSPPVQFNPSARRLPCCQDHWSLLHTLPSVTQHLTKLTAIPLNFLFWLLLNHTFWLFSHVMGDLSQWMANSLPSISFQILVRFGGLAWVIFVFSNPNLSLGVLISSFEYQLYADVFQIYIFSSWFHLQLPARYLLWDTQ